MNSVFVIGAHGQIGQMLVSKLATKKIKVYAGLRRKEQAAVFPTTDFIQPLLFDLTSSIKEIAAAFRKSQAKAIVFSAGSGGKTGDDQTLLIDLDGAVKSMIAAQAAGIKRYVMVSSIGSDNREVWAKSGLQPYLIAKHYADEELQRTQLDYTILRPGMLTNVPGSGMIEVNPQSNRRISIPREDVAAVIATVIDNRTTYKKSYTLGSGEIPIQEAF
ncbi:NAD(P)-binding oxidoreductase [Liquorilactobacillus capillatus]|uniref:NAD(P)-binding domain-containing protein n=1 Tax=Liquorilactobacillus capillatus DSM 19910 TaxID=1423731 RepID=A0A0R1MAR6_9LACO|nr:NAD(P)-binding oxidoreductase [Liquorilactobacillus capillatus]KRL01978.1 hypothetical protein FC81_GL000967 [Liquorilactobacillus capillatus DSM 19910]